jgi:acyl-CoA synthetase (AMP-forming)/AMP-acid ligase II
MKRRIGADPDGWSGRRHRFEPNVFATEEEIIAFAKHIASYKAPKSVELADALPKNPQKN